MCCFKLLYISERAVASVNLLCIQMSSAAEGVRAHQVPSPWNKNTTTEHTHEEKSPFILSVKVRPMSSLCCI